MTNPSAVEKCLAEITSKKLLDPGENMATHNEESIDASAKMPPGTEVSPQLTFTALNAKIDALPRSPQDPTIFPKKTKMGITAIIAGATFALLSIKLLPNNALYTVVLSSLGVVVEIAGIVVAALTQIPRHWPGFARERREFAEQLDFDLPYHLALIDWLRSFPLDQREKLSEFVTYRHARMKEKLPMLTGSIEKLGALPVIIALYLQFKDTRWPPHPSWLEICLIFVLVSGYWMSVLQISVRLRLQLYETLLSKALAEKAR